MVAGSSVFIQYKTVTERLSDSGSATRQTHLKQHMQYCYYYAAFNAPCVGHKDDESQAQLQYLYILLGDKKHTSYKHKLQLRPIKLAN